MTLAVRVTTALLLVAALATVCVYAVGLPGPFLLDDPANLAPVQRWLQGKISLREVLFGNGGPATWRALAMATLALNAQLGGFSPMSLKTGNLAIHLLCALAAYAWLARLLAQDQMFGTRAKLAAAFIICIWVLHPLNASTVLYSIQRMAQIAALCMLAGLWLYVALRQRIERGDRPGFHWAVLFAGIPLLTFLGIQGKQNAAVLPALCLILELCYFRPYAQWPKTIKGFYGLYLFAPTIIGTLLVAWKWPSVAAGYGEYAFTPGERLLTQARVLWEYILMLLAPNTPSMGIYTDDFPVSTSLIAPPTTLLALVAIISISITTWKNRNRYPTVAAGWGIFLVGHAVEGSFLPLDLYFEHRNYFPAFGLWMTAVALTVIAGDRLSGLGVRTKRIGVAACAAVLVALATLTHGRALVWSDALTLNLHTLRSHPDSPRAVVNSMGMLAMAGAHEAAYKVSDQAMLPERNAHVRALAGLTRVTVDCLVKRKSSAHDLLSAANNVSGFVDLSTFQVFSRLSERVTPPQTCNGVTQLDVANAAAITADRATDQPDTSWPKWRLRYLSAVLFANQGDWNRALAQGKLAWQPNTNGERAWVLVQALALNGEDDEAERVYQEALTRLNNKDPLAPKFRRQLDAALQAKPDR